MKHITAEDVREMTGTEGLVLQGCGGDPQEWVDGVNKMLTEAGILLEGDKFGDVSIFKHDGVTNLLFGMESVKLDIGKLAVWRLQTSESLGSIWLSDYQTNRLGGAEKEREQAAPREMPLILANYAYNGGGQEIRLIMVKHLAAPDEIAGILQNAGIDRAESRALYLDGLESVIPELDEALPDEVDIEEINYLAFRIGGMSEAERKLFSAIIAEEYHCGSPADIIDLTFNLGCYELLTINSPGEYGEFLLGVRRGDFASALESAGKSSDPSYQALAKYIRLMEKLVDFDRYGETALQNENRESLPFEYLISDEREYVTSYRSPEDIPTELRVFPSHPEPLEPCAKPSVLERLAAARDAKAQGKDSPPRREHGSRGRER